MKNKNKIIVKDEYGDRWFVTKKGVVQPTNWKNQALLEAARSKDREIQEKLYGRKGD